ncbi:sugar transporter-like protein [Saitoella coloradoensis]
MAFGTTRNAPSPEPKGTSSPSPSPSRDIAHNGRNYLGLRGAKLGWAITSVATIGFLLFGYDQGVMSGIITGEYFNKEFPATYGSDQHASTIQGTVTSVYELGCFAGALAALFLGERMGRLRTIFLGAVIMILGTVIQVTAFDAHFGLGQFIIGRVVTGVGNGFNTATIPTWQAECSTGTSRGMLVCIEAAMIAVGTFIAYWFDFGLSFVPSHVQWRLPIAFQIVFAIALIAGVSVLPESPRWLLAHGHEAEGTRVIAFLRGEGIDSEVVLREKRNIQAGIARVQTEGHCKNRDLLTGGKTQHLRRTLLGASSQVFQQLGGCNAVIYYCPVLFENSVHLDRTLSLVLGGVLATVYALSTLASFTLVEKLGRRPMFLIGSFGQMVAMIITFACLIPGSVSASKGAAFGLYLYIVFFGFTWLELPWLYPAEINPLRTRTKANAISTSANWIFNFMVVQVVPTMVASIGWGTYLFFAVMNALFIPVIYFYYPETKGRSLEEIDLLFAKGYLNGGGMQYVTVSKTMPRLTEGEVERQIAEIEGVEKVEGGVGVGNGREDVERGRQGSEPTLFNEVRADRGENVNDPATSNNPIKGG